MSSSYCTQRRKQQQTTTTRTKWVDISKISVSYHHHHHHHHQVARPAVSIAVSTTERHLERSCARSHAELRPRLVGCRSDSMVRSQVRRGRPLRRRQSVGRRLMAAWRAREWSCDGSAVMVVVRCCYLDIGTSMHCCCVLPLWYNDVGVLWLCCNVFEQPVDILIWYRIGTLDIDFSIYRYRIGDSIIVIFPTF